MLVLFVVGVIAIYIILHRTMETYRNERFKSINKRFCHTEGRLYKIRNDTDKKVLDMSRRLVKNLLDHLKTQKKSKNSREIVGWMSHENVFLFTGPNAPGGRLKRESSSRKACMFINPDIEDNRIEGRLQSKICHELAHVTGKGHDMKWRDTWKYLLNLSSRDLGWKNHLNCGSCIRYKICNKKMCPRCTWTGGDHTTCKPLNKRGILLN